MRKKDARFYEKDGIKLPSVTTILGIIAKPALVNWASYGARDATIAAARALYEVSDRGISGVSFESALKRYLGRGPAHRLLQEEALDVGIMVHARIESEMRRELGQDVPLVELPESNPDGSAHAAWLAYQAYRGWRADHDVRPVAAELRVYSMAGLFAGTTDLLAYVSDRLTIVDYKTSNAVYAEYRLQIAAYRAAYLEMNPGVAAWCSPELGLGGLILRLAKNGQGFEAADVPWAEQDELLRVFLAARVVWEWEYGQATE